MTKVFIDGSAGTTGLRIHSRLSRRSDLSLLILPEELRKDTAARKEAINQSNVAFLCLPDGAAVEAASFVTNPHTVIIDTSTAHRTHPDWSYGFAEVTDAEILADAKRIANPGCHASGFIALVKPLRDAGLLREDALLSCVSLTGYSGGGKKMIAQYEAPDRSPLLSAPRQYALSQQHKHLKEMVHLCKLQSAPAFCPIVADFYSGMEVSVPVFAKDLKGTLSDVKALFASLYRGPVVFYRENAEEEGFLSAAAFSGKDGMEITVGGNQERILLTARYDNLGKGASGAAIQNMNIVLGMEQTAGLEL